MSMCVCHLEIKLMFVRQKSNTVEISSRSLGNGEWKGVLVTITDSEEVRSHSSSVRWFIHEALAPNLWWRLGNDLEVGRLAVISPNTSSFKSFRGREAWSLRTGLGFILVGASVKGLNLNKNNVWAFTQVFQKTVTDFLLPPTYLTSQSSPPPRQPPDRHL